MQKTKQKRKSTPHDLRHLRPIYFLPLIIAYGLLCISSWFGSITISLLSQTTFIYPLMYFLHNTLLHWALAFCFAMAWLVILIRKGSSRHILWGIVILVFSVFVYVGLLMTLGEMRHLDSYSTPKYEYHLTNMDTQSLMVSDSPLQRSVLRCDSLMIMCDILLSQDLFYAKYVPKEFLVDDGKLLVVQEPHWLSGNEETIYTVIDDSLED